MSTVELVTDHVFRPGDGFRLWRGRCCVEGCHKLQEEHAEVHTDADEEWSPLDEMESIEVPLPRDDLPIYWTLIIHGIEEIRCRNIRELIEALQRPEIREAVYKYSASLMRMEEMP